MRFFMTRMVFSVISLFFVVVVGFNGGSEAANVNSPTLELPKADDLSALVEFSQKQHLPILLMYSAEDCEYCDLLEAEVLRPMMISGELGKRVIFRKIDVDDIATIKDFNGKAIDPEKFAFSKGVQVTPTLQFVDGNGDELVPKIIGYQGTEFFNAYLDSAILNSKEKLSDH